MKKCENNPFVKIKNDLDFIPLLDSGFYFHKDKPKLIIKKEQI